MIDDLNKTCIAYDSLQESYGSSHSVWFFAMYINKAVVVSQSLNYEFDYYIVNSDVQ